MGTLTTDWKCNFESWTPSTNRRHGDFFPLPRLAGPAKNFPMWQRLVDESARSLNALAATENLEPSAQPVAPTKMQSAVLDRLGELSQAAGSPPAMTSKKALDELAASADQYEL